MCGTRPTPCVASPFATTSLSLTPFQRQLALLSLLISVLSSTLGLLSTHYTYYPDAAVIVKNLLLPKWSSKLNAYLSMSHNELILVTLKLYNALTAFSGGRERRALLDVFPWDAKVRMLVVRGARCALTSLHTVRSQATSHAPEAETSRDCGYACATWLVQSPNSEASLTSDRYPNALCPASAIVRRCHYPDSGQNYVPRTPEGFLHASIQRLRSRFLPTRAAHPRSLLDRSLERP